MTKPGRPPIDDHYTPAEWRVLHATRHGMSNKEMAKRMGISINAIKYHIRNILEKSGLPNKKTLLTHNLQSKNFKSHLTNEQEQKMKNSNDVMSIGQISRTVSDINLSKNWYELVLEIPHLYSFGDIAFFDINGSRLMLNQSETFNPNESIIYFLVNDIITMSKKLEEKDVEFIAAPHKIHQHEDGTQEWMAFFNDPDNRPMALMSRIKI